MASDLGYILLLLAMVLAVYSAAGSVLGARRGIPELVQSARFACYLIVPLLLAATGLLVVLFLSHDFQVSYVFLHSNLAMKPIYTWVAFYAGNEGSLLYIATAFSVLAALAVALAPKRLWPSTPYTTAVLMLMLTFFLGVMATLANPFARLDFIPGDGQGINPLLTHPGMFIHPPMLMAGLVSVTIPFSFAMGHLLAGRTGDEWVDTGRAWGIVAWAILGTGNLLGAWWAYTILGWGGYWGWDAIEIVGLMPWLVLTAFIHSIMVQKRRGMFRMWNIALINVALGLALFGMFINRGGPVPSVHSFGASKLGWIFLSFMGLSVALSFAVFFWRYGRLKSARPLESMLSRESAFLVNNFLFLFVAFVSLWGVIYPLISQAFQGVTVTVGAPFYVKVNGSVFLGIIFLMGIGPLLPWHRASWRTLGKALLIPGLSALAVAISLPLVGLQKPFAVASFALCTLVAASVLQEWVRGTAARHTKGENYLLAFLWLVAANRPRYGGYVVHLAVVALALGVVASSSYDIQRDVVLAPGQRVEVGDYTIEYVGWKTAEMADRTEFSADLRLYRGESFLGTVTSWQAFYPQFRMNSTRAAIRSTP
ncbi:MAG: heme lyase CcmF/NrfE family subunit, partial [Chloroflexi bacterium]|nr:heme lyase CcmF/NrfE family subunit [Chloroflexota bacterium]